MDEPLGKLDDSPVRGRSGGWSGRVLSPRDTCRQIIQLSSEIEGFVSRLTCHCGSYLRALNTWGIRQQSARVISSPTQYLPAEDDRSFSKAEIHTNLYFMVTKISFRFSLFLNLLDLVHVDNKKTLSLPCSWNLGETRDCVPLKVSRCKVWIHSPGIKNGLPRNPRFIQCWAHSFFFSSPTYMSTNRFCKGCIPDWIISHNSRTWNKKKSVLSADD